MPYQKITQQQKQEETKYPSVCLLSPFVWYKTPDGLPFVVKNTPNIGNRIFSGFTLIELIVTVTIAAILIAIAVPGLNNFVETNRLTSATNEFVADQSFARSEALKRGANTGVCKTGGGSACVTDDTSWEDGWMVFVDADNNESWSTGDEPLRLHVALPPNTSITVSSGSAAPIVYGRQGQALEGADIYVFCNSRIGRKRDIRLLTSGRFSVTEGVC